MTKLNTPGDFRAVVNHPDSGWFGETGSGTPYIRLPLQVIDGPETGKGISWFGWLNEKNVDRTLSNLAEALEFDGDLNGLYNGTKSFAGAVLSIKVEQEEYKGKLDTKVRFINHPLRQRGPADPQAMSALLASLAPRASAIARSLQPPTPSAPRPPAPPKTPVSIPTETDDMPY